MIAYVENLDKDFPMRDSLKRQRLASRQVAPLRPAIGQFAQAWVRIAPSISVFAWQTPTASQRAQPRVWSRADAPAPCANRHGKAQKGVPICTRKWLTPLPTANRVRLVGRRTRFAGRKVPTTTWVEI